MSKWVKISLNCTTIRQISQSFYVKCIFLRIPVQYVVLFTRSYIEQYKELNEGGDNLLLHAVKHSYIYDAERKSMIIGGNGR